MFEIYNNDKLNGNRKKNSKQLIEVNLLYS